MQSVGSTFTPGHSNGTSSPSLVPSSTQDIYSWFLSSGQGHTCTCVGSQSSVRERGSVLYLGMAQEFGILLSLRASLLSKEKALYSVQR